MLNILDRKEKLILNDDLPKVADRLAARIDRMENRPIFLGFIFWITQLAATFAFIKLILQNKILKTWITK